MIELKYRNTEDQICDFSMYRATNSEDYKKTLKKKSYTMSALFIAAALIYIFMGFKIRNQEQLMFGVVLASIFALFAVINFFFFEKYANNHVKKTIKKSLIKKGNLIDTDIKVKFDGKKIKVVRGKEKSNIKPESIIEIVELNDCVCIAAKGDVGIVIPYNAFKTKEDRIELINNLKNI